MHLRTSQPPSAVPRHLDRSGLLQGFVGEQPLGHIRQPCELRLRLPTQHDRLDQHSRTVTETSANCRDVGDSAGVPERIATDLGECRAARVADQVGDVVPAEIQDGLTPVSMTL